MKRGMLRHVTKLHVPKANFTHTILIINKYIIYLQYLCTKINNFI